jgi:hypothetical protein
VRLARLHNAGRTRMPDENLRADFVRQSLTYGRADAYLVDVCSCSDAISPAW